MKTLEKVGRTYRVEESENRKEFIFEKEEYKGLIQIDESDALYRICAYYDIEVFLTKEQFSLLVQEVEKEAQKKQKWVIIDGSETLIEGLDENKYRTIFNKDEEEEDIYSIYWEDMTMMISELTEDDLYQTLVSKETAAKMIKFLQLQRRIVEELEEFSEGILMFDYEKDYYTHYVHAFGFNFNLKFSIRENKLYVSTNDNKLKSFACSTLEEFLNSFVQWLQEIEQKQRIKNIMDPSAYFISKMMEKFERIIPLSYPDDYTDQRRMKLKQLLRKQFTSDFSPLVLQKMAAVHFKNGLPDFHEINTDHFFFFFGEKGYLVDRTHYDIHVMEKSPNIEENIKKILHEKLEKEIDNNLKGIL